MRRGTPIALAVAALALAGCGGDGDDGGQAEEASTNDTLACVQDEGLKAIATAGDEPLGVTGALRISLPPENRMTVDFFEDPDQAREYSAGQASFLSPTGGTSEVVADTVVIGVLRGGAQGELARVRGCIEQEPLDVYPSVEEASKATGLSSD